MKGENRTKINDEVTVTTSSYRRLLQFIMQEGQTFIANQDLPVLQ